MLDEPISISSSFLGDSRQADGFSSSEGSARTGARDQPENIRISFSALSDGKKKK